MKHVFRKLIVLLLVLAIVLSMLPAVFAAVGTLKPNSGTRDQVCTELSAKAQAYYTGTYSYESLSALAGASDTTTSYNAAQNNPLYTALNRLMTATHTNQNVRYDGYAANSLATYWTQTDTENSGSTYLFFYTDILASDPSVSSLQMQREHVWPKSRASYYQKGGGSDLHHLRPSIGGVNASKSNNAFANLNGSGSAYSVNGQPVIWTGSKDGVGGVLEVRDNVKGDVARILLYVYVRWQQPNLYSDVAAELLPEFDADDSQNTGGRAIESLSTLLQWMQKDPVDTWEMSRNDQIENVQGNRNVFIDYPELAYLMFNWPIPKMQTPSGKALGTDPTTPTELTEPTTAPTNPTAAPTEPTSAPTEPTTAPTEPTAVTEPKGDEYALTTALKDGDEVVIFNPAAGMAMSEDTVSINYRAGVAATVLNNCIYTDNSKIVWRVTKTDGGYTFANDNGETLSATKGLSFATTDNVWAVNPAATANSIYLVSTTAAGTSGDPKCVEWYGRYNEFSTYYYSDTLESDFALQLFVKTGNVAPTEPTEPTTAPTEPTTAPTEPTTAPTQPTTAPTEPTTAPTEPTTAPTQPTTAPTEPTTAPTEPTTAPTEPTTAPSGNEYVLTTTLKNGDEVIIYNAGAKKAMSEDAVSTNYRAGADVTVSNNKIVTDDSKIVWKVTKTADGYTFTNDNGETLSATKGLSFATTDNVWAINPATTANSVYIVSTTAVGSSGDPKYVEWYDKYTEFSTYYYSEASEAIFAMQLFVRTDSVAPTEPTTAPTEPTTAPTEPTTAPTQPTAAPTEPTTAPTEPTTAPSGNEYVLTTTLKNGDEVIIYNAGAKKAMSEDAVSTNYRAGADVTVSNNKIVTDDSKIVWKVTKTADGYTFTNDNGETLSATKGLSFATTDNVWAINPAATANSVYIVSTTATGSSGDPKYVEWYDKYTEFSTYYYSEASEAIFAMQLFVRTNSVAPTEPTTAPTEPTTAPTEPTTAPTQPTTAPTEPTTAPTEPTTAPTQPTTAPTEPTTAPTEPTTAPTEPTTAPVDPTVPTTPAPQTYYTVTWYVGSRVYREQYAKGEMPVFTGSTDKPADGKYTYTFTGWSPKPVPVTADATYIAIYEATPIHPEGTYLITWIVDGTKTTLPYQAGVMPTYPGSTDKPDDENFVYCFAGWSPAVEKVTRDATYTARYNKIPLRKYDPFLDVPKSAWYYEEVNRAAQLGLFNGVSYQRFDPNGNVSRAMVVTVLYRMEGEPEADDAMHTFTDVPVGAWYYDAVVWASNAGIAKGFSEITFAPNESVTREQFAAFLYRYAEWKGYDVSGRGKLTGFADRGSISGYAETALAWAVDSDMLRGMDVNGSLCLAPQGTATRAQAASIMVRFFNAFVK